MDQIKISLDDWYDLCDKFKEDTNGILSWTYGYCGCDYNDGEAIQINRDFLKSINQLIQKKMDEKNG